MNRSSRADSGGSSSIPYRPRANKPTLRSSGGYGLGVGAETARRWPIVAAAVSMAGAPAGDRALGRNSRASRRQGVACALGGVRGSPLGTGNGPRGRLGAVTRDSRIRARYGCFRDVEQLQFGQDPACVQCSRLRAATVYHELSPPAGTIAPAPSERQPAPDDVHLVAAAEVPGQRPPSGGACRFPRRGLVPPREP